MICWNDAPGQVAAISNTKHLHPRPSSSLITHRIPAPTARQQPHLAEIRRWRRQSVQMGREICVCLSSGNSVNRHFPRSRELFRTDRGRPCPREWEGPASEALREGWSEAEVCAEKLPLRGDSALRALEGAAAAASGSSCGHGRKGTMT